ncbi:MAG TPA: radical SAM protein [Bacteroidetes bacterium]|nr:radical SAM protein [Bacteroidota bacterium]
MLPAYRRFLTLKELTQRGQLLRERMNECRLCPRECGVHRAQKQYGVCRSTDDLTIASASPHYGEERPLVGLNGSGTIFFTSCNLKCQFCQNYDISYHRIGRAINAHQLAEIMLSLQGMGCHNINLVTPSHFTPQIVEALVIGVERGLTIPLVYNCGGYESVQTLKLLDGIIDLYMPDIKYSNNEAARKYSGAKDYWDVVRLAVKEMHRQTGDLATDERGIATRGLIIRHLVLPNGIAGSMAVMEYIAHELSLDSYVNIMDQYRPVHRAHRYPELDRPIVESEYDEVVDYALKLGLHRGFNVLELRSN